MAKTWSNMTIERPAGAIMTPTDVEHITSDRVELEATPPVARQVSTSLFQSRERRWWATALTSTILIAVIGIGFLYVDDSSNQASVRSLTTQNESLTGRNQIIKDQLNKTQANLTASLGELATTKAALEHPHLTIWNVQQQLKGPN